MPVMVNRITLGFGLKRKQSQSWAMCVSGELPGHGLHITSDAAELIAMGCVGFPGGSVVKNLPANQEMQVRSHGREDPLEKEIATHSSILTRKISWTEEPGGL